MKTKLLLLLLVVFQLATAQQRTCGMEEHMEKIMADPILRARHLELQALIQTEYERLLAEQVNHSRVANPNVTLQIPVAVHYPEVLSSTSEAQKTCLRNLAQSQINVINADYNALNTDLFTWTNTASAFYPGVNVGDLDVEFIIATQNHPAGTGLTNGMQAITFGTDFLNGADSDLTWTGYMNFVVRDEGNQLLGYSPLAGSPSFGQTVVMNTFCFGSVGNGCSGYQPQSPFNLGRTVTHELGHFFNLDHIFKSDLPSATNCSGSDADGIADTPKQAAATYGCIAAGSKNACVTGEKVLSMNYMDYSDDACMYMFTAGQKTKMQAYLNIISSQFNSNVLLSREELVNNDFSIYPNPNKGVFEIQFKEFQESLFIQVYDNTGRLVYENDTVNENSLTKTITLDSVPTGVYFISIKSNASTITKKIIVQ